MCEDILSSILSNKSENEKIKILGILDLLLNLEKVILDEYHDYLLEYSNSVVFVGDYHLKHEFKELLEREIILVDRQGDFYFINPTCRDKIKKRVEEFLDKRGITKESRERQIEESIKNKPSLLSRFIPLLGGYYYEVFQNYPEVSTELKRLSLIFEEYWTTKEKGVRHVSYHFRVEPFKTEEIIKNVVRKILFDNIDRRKLIFVLLLKKILEIKNKSNTRGLRIDTLKCRFRVDSLTISDLQDWMVIEYIDHERISLEHEVSMILLRTFFREIYDEIKSNIIRDFYKKLTNKESFFKTLSSFLISLNIFKTLKGELLETKELTIEHIPIRIIGGEILKEDSNDKRYGNILIRKFLEEAQDIGIVIEIDDKLLLFEDIINEIKERIYSIISEDFIFIQSHTDREEIIEILREKIFSKCVDFVYIIDPYVNHETIEILKKSLKDMKNVSEIRIIAGVCSYEFGSENIDNFRTKVNELVEERKKENQKLEVFFVGKMKKKHSEKDKCTHLYSSPFHDRYIITRNRLWIVGTSIKDLGKDKDSTIVLISNEDTIKDFKESFINNLLEIPLISHKEVEYKNKNEKFRLNLEEWYRLMKGLR